jgi:CRP/FNR family transcriptional regulator
LNHETAELANELRASYPAPEGLGPRRKGERRARAAVVPGDARLVVLPKPVFDDLLAAHAAFRQHVFSLFAERLTDLMALVEAVAFHKLDRRIAAALLGRGRVVVLTHQQLADELGSVREIVTRVLRGFADQGWVQSSRGSIEVLDAAALRRVAEGS